MDFKNLLEVAATKLLQLVVNQLPIVQEMAQQYINGTRDRLTLLAQAMIKGEISKDFVLGRLKDEAEIMYAQLLSFGVVGAQITQDIVNDILKPFINELETYEAS